MEMILLVNKEYNLYIHLMVGVVFNHILVCYFIFFKAIWKKTKKKMTNSLSVKKKLLYLYC